jgi:putative transposase
MKADRDASLVMDALMMAVWRRGKADALLHNSDQGSQYTSEQSSVCCSTMTSPAR